MNWYKKTQALITSNEITDLGYSLLDYSDRENSQSGIISTVGEMLVNYGTTGEGQLPTSDEVHEVIRELEIMMNNLNEEIGNISNLISKLKKYFKLF